MLQTSNHRVNTVPYGENREIQSSVGNCFQMTGHPYMLRLGKDRRQYVQNPQILLRGWACYGKNVLPPQRFCSRWWSADAPSRLTSRARPLAIPSTENNVVEVTLAIAPSDWPDSAVGSAIALFRQPETVAGIFVDHSRRL